MNLKIKLKDWRCCEGCPCLTHEDIIPGRFGFHTFCSMKYKVNKYKFDPKRSKKCIKENGR